VRESRTPGSVRGAVSDDRPYRDPYFAPEPGAIACQPLIGNMEEALPVFLCFRYFEALESFAVR
jgi:hypothetical protein